MLSPLRRGSGLYFSTLCAPKCRGDPHAALRGHFRNINVGSCFQAELPALRDPSEAQHDEEPASLLWKPWGDMDTDPQAQDPVATLLSLASSSGVPGRVPNLELALHCLHAARGDVTKALEMLLSGGPPKSETDPLANYHYAGSDTWTPLEKQLFHRAFAIHKKDFYLIHKRVQTKTVAQCVEYYYIWKKKTKLQSYRAKGKDNKLKRNKEKAEEKANRSPKKRRLAPEEKGELRQKVPQNEGAKESFPCTGCGRAFATIRGGNAHMKRHRAPEPQTGIEPPPECLEIREKPAEMARVAIPEPQAGTEPPPKCLENEGKPPEMEITEPEPQAVNKPPLKRPNIEEKPAETVIAAPEPQAGTEPPPKRLKTEEEPPETAIAAPALEQHPG
ncbi:hypothetical protein Q9233_017886 [Columba guinea]|nr:hypothetical protein Q9233_017886 [Columba guinea]